MMSSWPTDKNLLSNFYPVHHAVSSLTTRTAAGVAYGWILKIAPLLVALFIFTACGERGKAETDELFTVETAHFVVRAHDETIARRNAEVLEQFAYPYLEAVWRGRAPVEVTPKFEVLVLSGREEQKRHRSGAHGSYSLENSTITYGFVEENFPQTIFHEFFHQYMHRVVFRGDSERYAKAPVWLDEGLATMNEHLTANYRLGEPLHKLPFDAMITRFGIPVYRLDRLKGDFTSGRLLPLEQVLSWKDRSQLDQVDYGYAWSVAAYLYLEHTALLVQLVYAHAEGRMADAVALESEIRAMEESWQQWVSSELSEPEAE